MKNQERVTYTGVSIYYFSGTGNAKFAARQIQKNCEEEGLHTKVFNIAEQSHELESVEKDALLGFCFPTHGFNAPPIVINFLLNFPRGKANVFLLNTRAGLKMSKLHIPGIGGLALWLPALILLFKGYNPIGFRPLDMPSNWIPLHPGLKKHVIFSIHKRCSVTLKRFTDRLLSGKWVLNGFLWLPIDILLAPISIGYYWFGRFALAKSFFANSACNNCNICIEECPVNAIIEKDGRPFWTLNCESCMHCMNVCPHRAIETPHAYLLPLWWLAFSAAPIWIMKLLVKYEVIPITFYSQYIDLIFYLIMIPVGFALFIYGYRFLHWLLGFEFINKIITYTSLTHYSWWRRYRFKNRETIFDKQKT
jgi:Pyruvate/2-oxoacid:ferredoxin oxidoreductase delta subunit